MAKASFRTADAVDLDKYHYFKCHFSCTCCRCSTVIMRGEWMYCIRKDYGSDKSHSGKSQSQRWSQSQRSPQAIVSMNWFCKLCGEFLDTDEGIAEQVTMRLTQQDYPGIRRKRLLRIFSVR